MRCIVFIHIFQRTYFFLNSLSIFYLVSLYPDLQIFFHSVHPGSVAFLDFGLPVKFCSFNPSIDELKQSFTLNFAMLQ